MCILGNPGKEYFSKFNLPKNYVEYFDSVKIRGIENFEGLINEDGFYDKKEAKNAADLILNMLNWDINKRFSAEQCLNHPFLYTKKKYETPLSEFHQYHGKENMMQ